MIKAVFRKSRKTFPRIGGEVTRAHFDVFAAGEFIGEVSIIVAEGGKTANRQLLMESISDLIGTEVTEIELVDGRE